MCEYHISLFLFTNIYTYIKSENNRVVFSQV